MPILMSFGVTPGALASRGSTTPRGGSCAHARAGSRLRTPPATAPERSLSTLRRFMSSPLSERSQELHRVEQRHAPLLAGEDADCPLGVRRARLVERHDAGEGLEADDAVDDDRGLESLGGHDQCPLATPGAL